MDKHKDDKSKPEKTENTTTTENSSEAESAAKPEAKTPAPSEKPRRQLDPANDPDDFADYIRSDEKAQKFMMMYMLAHDGLTQNDFQDEMKRREFLAHFEAWKKAGEPGITLPKLPKSEVKYPTALYRLRNRSKDYLYAYYSDGSEEGIKYIPRYEQIENPLTGQLEDSKIKIGETESYDMLFTDKKVRELIKLHNDLAPPGVKPLALHIWFGDNKQTISEENFFKSHETLAELFNNKKPLN